MKRVLVDTSSVIWTALQGGRDKEFGRIHISEAGKEVLVNSAGYGFENAMSHLVKMMADLDVTPRQLIFVVEGRDSKRDRQAIHPLYKSGRDKVSEAYVQFNLCKERILSAFLGVGAQACWQDGGVESDDVLGYLAYNLDGVKVVDSGDKDLAVLVDPSNDIHHYRAGKIDENPFGDFPHRFIPVCIALVGDSGDKIPGAKGFGDKAFQLMHMAFGDDGLELMEDLIKRKKLLDLEEDVGSLRELQRIIDDMDGVYMSYELGRLRTERVNTMKRPLQWRVGMVKPREQCEEQSLRKHAGVNRIVSAENYDEAVQFARKQIELSPYVTLDVETWTPPESDDWLESRDKADKVDVFGSNLASVQITMGRNLNFSLYLAHDNVEEGGCTNLSKDQIRSFISLIPQSKVTYVHNAAFEIPVLFNTLGPLGTPSQEQAAWVTKQ